MSAKKRFYIVGTICFVLAIFLICAVGSFLAKENKSTKELSVKPTKKELPKSKEYLSITYTTSDSSTKTGRMMNFYTYDILSDKLTEHAKIPFDSQYALGAVSLSENKIYYTQGVEAGDSERSVDHLFEYDLGNQRSAELEESNCAYNDIIPIKGKLLVTTIPVHAIGTGLFDISSKKISYLYDTSVNEDGYEDFLFRTEPTPLNYNHHYERFVNVSSLEKDFYNERVRDGEKALKYRIALVDDELNVKNECTYSLKSIIDYRIAAVTQISKEKVLLLVQKDLSEDEDSELECENQFYVIDFTDNSCKKVKTPFPKMRYIDNFITVDDGESYYISGENTDGASGLFSYDCSNGTMKAILLGDLKEDNHVVNFCLIKQ